MPRAHQDKAKEPENGEGREAAKGRRGPEVRRVLPEIWYGSASIGTNQIPQTQLETILVIISLRRGGLRCPSSPSTHARKPRTSVPFVFTLRSFKHPIGGACIVYL